MGRAVTPLLRVTARVCYSCIEQQQQQQQQQHNRSSSSAATYYNNANMNSSSVHSSTGSEDATLALEALTEALKLLLCALGARGRLTAQGQKEVSFFLYCERVTFVRLQSVELHFFEHLGLKLCTCACTIYRFRSANQSLVIQCDECYWRNTTRSTALLNTVTD
jgi:hypothetical protein